MTEVAIENMTLYLNLLAGVDKLRQEAWAIVESEGEHRGLKVIIARLHELETDGERIRDEHLEALANLAFVEGHTCSRPQFVCEVCEAVEYVERHVR